MSPQYRGTWCIIVDCMHCSWQACLWSLGLVTLLNSCSILACRSVFKTKPQPPTMEVRHVHLYLLYHACTCAKLIIPCTGLLLTCMQAQHAIVLRYIQCVSLLVFLQAYMCSLLADFRLPSVQLMTCFLTNPTTWMRWMHNVSAITAFMHSTTGLLPSE